MSPAYAKKLSLQIQKTNVGVQKIDESTLEIFEMTIASLRVTDKLSRAHFFQETFLMANTSMKVVLGIFFLTFSNADIWFAKKELI